MSRSQDGTTCLLKTAATASVGSCNSQPNKSRAVLVTDNRHASSVWFREQMVTGLLVTGGSAGESSTRADLGLAAVQRGEKGPTDNHHVARGEKGERYQ
jgi:hypothetical protein